MKTTADQPSLKLTKNAVTVLERRYLKKAADGKLLETPSDLFRRVANAVASAESEQLSSAELLALENRFFQMMTDLEFLPNSPTLMNAGRELGQLSACFVLPVGDSMEEIFEAIKQAALVHKSGGGTGFSFSRLRPANDPVQSTQGVASGPLSFMRVFDAATETIKQGGTRRGANMGILRVDHPDIMDFIMMKRDQTVLNNFNLSVGITEAFMEAAEAGREFDLIHPKTKQVVGKMDAAKVFRQIVEMAWLNGEPGIVFLDRMNRDNPIPHICEIEATNPCGEQPLPPFSSCVLGSINLSKMLTIDNKINWTKLKAAVESAVRFLDNIITVNKYPLEQIREMTQSSRHIGLGIMGWADLLIEMGIPYGSDQSIALAEKLMKTITEDARNASIQLAEARGAFPVFKGSIYDRPDHRQIRNATCTTIAPTGTISILANASSGIEPLFAVAFVKNVMDNDKLFEVNPIFERIAKERGFYSRELIEKIAEKGSLAGIDEIPEDVQELFVTAHDISPEAHIRMQAAFQKHTDNAVSKTVNFCNSATKEDVESVFRLAYQLGCKGVTIYRDGSRDMQVLSTVKKAEAPLQVEPPKPVVQLVKPEPAAPVKRNRPKALRGATYQMETGCGPLYTTINSDSHGFFEVFTTMGKAGGCAASQCEAMGRLISLGWRSGLKPQQMVKQLVGITCHKPLGFGGNKITSCADAVAKAIQLHMEDELFDNEEVEPLTKAKMVVGGMGACPDCGGSIEHEGGCCVCRSCGYSECA